MSETNEILTVPKDQLEGGENLQSGENLEGGALFNRPPLRKTEVSDRKKTLLNGAEYELKHSDLAYQYATLVAEEIKRAKNAKSSETQQRWLGLARGNVENALTAEESQPLGQMDMNFVRAEELTKDQIDKNVTRLLTGMRPALGSTYKVSQVGPAVKVNNLVNEARVLNGEQPYAKPPLSLKTGKLL